MRNAEIKEMVLESKGLTQKLEELEKQKQQTLKETAQHRVKPLQPKVFRKVKPEFNAVASHISSGISAEQREQKLKKLQEDKEKQEKVVCTFKPELNSSSLTMVSRGHHVPPHERPLPKPEPKAEPAPEPEPEPVKKDLPPIDQHYYQKQIEWLASIEERNTKERLEKAIKDYSRKEMIPKVNKKKNEKMVHKDEDFLKRVEQDLEKSKLVKDKLDKKYNAHQFKPKLNRNFKEVQPLYLSKVENNDDDKFEV